MQKRYKKIIALDFELFNSKYYWSVCWAGIIEADAELGVVGCFDIVFNPSTRHKFIGKDMTLPFTYDELKKHASFGEGGHKVLEHLGADTLVVGHAFENDLRMLIDSCNKFGLALPDFDYIDSNVIFNVVSGEGGEHSLKSLAEKFGIEFIPHNPVDDARAALAVAKAVVDGQNIYEFLEKNRIFVGGICGGLIKKCYHGGMPLSQRKRIENFNKVCGVAKKHGQGADTPCTGKSYYIESQIASDADTTPLCKKLLERGDSLAGSALSADFVITNNLSLYDEPKNISLKMILSELDIGFERYDFTPSKIRGADGKSITLSDYYSQAYRKFERKGFLYGYKFSFCKDIERLGNFEADIIVPIVSEGGKISVKVNESDYFVVNNLDDLKNNKTDGRIKAYNHSKNPTVLELCELLAILENKNIEIENG